MHTDDPVQDQRHQKRISRMQALFAHSASHGKSSSTHPEYVEQFLAQQDQIDAKITKAAPEWPIEQINQVDLAILRSIIFESMVKKTPIKVLLNEAVEIAKLYGTESSPKFINGALGKILIDSKSLL